MTNCIQKLVCHGPWPSQKDQFDLLYFLAEELEMSLENENQRYLEQLVLISVHRSKPKLTR